jgi:DNA-binding CsgD family transcriptional regulator
MLKQREAGKTFKEIGEAMNLSEGAVKYHVYRAKVRNKRKSGSE